MFKQKNDKHLLAVGCSFTDPNFSTLHVPDYDCSFPKWPEILANKLDVDVVNLGRSGSNNQAMVNMAIDHILDNKPWLVVVGLTEAWRYSVYTKYWINPIVGARTAISTSDPYSDSFCKFLKSYFPVSTTLVKDLLFEEGHMTGDFIRRNIFYHYFENIIRLQKMCDRFDIKLIISPLLWPLAAHPPAEIANALGRNYDHIELQKQIAVDFMNTENFDDVDPKTCLGWPWLEELGGTFPTHQTSGFVQYDDGTSPYRIPEDHHPNALGHQLIAEKFYEFYVKKYSKN